MSKKKSKSKSKTKVIVTKQEVPFVRSNPVIQHTDSEKNKLITKLLAKVGSVVGVITTIGGLTGFTIWNLWPDPELNILNPTDQNNIVLELKNNSFLAMQKIRPTLYVDTISTLEGDVVKRFMMNVQNAERLKLSKGQSYAFNYDLNNMFFEYDHPPQLFKANIAIAINYKSFILPCEDIFFFECRPDYHGRYMWVKTPQQSFVDDIKKDTAKANLNEIPYIRKLRKQAKESPEKFRKLENIPPIPKSVLE